MNDQNFEKESTEERVIREEFNAWKNIVKEKGEYDDLNEETGFDFVVDRRDEPEAALTGDDVYITDINEPIEEYTNTPDNFKTIDGERWIHIRISPKDPYHPKIASLTDKGGTHHYVETTYLFLSNLGRAYEHTMWDSPISDRVKKIHKEPHPGIVYWKVDPKPEEVDEILDPSATPEETETEPFRTLEGRTLERLDFLKFKVQAGQYNQYPGQEDSDTP